jgi:hypothetical protein
MATTVIAAFYELEGQLGYTLLNIQDEIFSPTEPHARPFPTVFS